MFEIDLKRSVGRSRTSGEAPQEILREVATSLAAPLAVLAGVSLALWFASGRMDASIARAEARADEVHAKVAEQRQELAGLTGRKRVLFGVQPSEIYWSDVLRLLSEKVPDKVWIQKVHLSSPEDPAQATVLRIEGGVLSSESEGNLDLIGRFLATLQDDERYGKTFGAPRLTSITRIGGDTHALAFQVALPLEKR